MRSARAAVVLSRTVPLGVWGQIVVRHLMHDVDEQRCLSVGARRVRNPHWRHLKQSGRANPRAPPGLIQVQTACSRRPCTPLVVHTPLSDATRSRQPFTPTIHTAFPRRPFTPPFQPPRARRSSAASHRWRPRAPPVRAPCCTAARGVSPAQRKDAAGAAWAVGVGWLRGGRWGGVRGGRRGATARRLCNGRTGRVPGTEDGRRGGGMRGEGGASGCARGPTAGGQGRGRGGTEIRMRRSGRGVCVRNGCV